MTFFKKNQKTILRICIVGLGIYIYTLFVMAWLNRDINDKRGIFATQSFLFFGIWATLLGRTHCKSIKVFEKKYIAVIYALVIPAICTYIEEYVWNSALTELSIQNFFLNYSIFLLLSIPFIFITQKPMLVWTVMVSIGYLYGVLNFFVIKYRGNPPLFGDFLVANTAITVASSYEIYFTDEILTGLFVLLILYVYFLYFPVKQYRYSFTKGQLLVSGGGVISLIVVMALLLQLDLKGTFHLSINGWWPVESFYVNGAPVTLLLSAQEMHPNIPEGYSPNKVKNILSMPESSIYETRRSNFETMPSVIVIMNESFSDLSVLGDINTDNVLKKWNSIDGYLMKGYVYASVYGAGTCNSEFEILTGSSMANVDVGTTYPYRFYNLSRAYNLVKVFKDLNYETVALHPYYADNWNRVQTYESFGFEKYITGEDMEDVRVISWCASDEYDYEWVKKIYEERTKPLFLFNVTMQNHGGYGILQPDIEPEVIEEEYQGWSDVVAYMTLIRESDTAFADLLEYFAGQSDPVIVCMFGDHQPNLNNHFLNSLYNPDSLEESERMYMTPYVIWSNYDLQAAVESDKNMSINYLGANILSLLGIQTDYSHYLLDMENQIPIINRAGYQTQDGTWHEPGEENEKISEYKLVQYYELFDKK